MHQYFIVQCFWFECVIRNLKMYMIYQQCMAGCGFGSLQIKITESFLSKPVYVWILVSFLQLCISSFCWWAGTHSVVEMSLNEELVQATNDSFWEIGKYSRTVKRIDNGKALCDNLRQLIQQRSEIETSYAKNLTNWSKKWNEFLEKGIKNFFLSLRETINDDFAHNLFFRF